MKISSQDSKLQVFVSSRCSNLDSNMEEINQYNIIRRSIKRILEDTGLFNVYIFEEAMASASSSQESYLNKIDRSDIILFLIDSRNGMQTDAITKEHNRAKDIGKPRLYIIYENGEMTSIQKELQGPDGVRYKTAKSLADIVDLAVESVICEVLENYSNFYMKQSIDLEEKKVDSVDSLTESFLKDDFLIDKFEYENTKSLFEQIADPRITDTNRISNEHSNEYDKIYSDFLLYRINKKKVLDLNWSKLARKDLFEESFYPYLEKRAKAFCAYHEGEYEEAYEILLKLYEELESSQIPKWYTQDILIDLRHLESKKNRLLNIVYSEEGIQKKISNIKTPLYYPLVDRFRENSFHKIIKERNKDNLRSEFSVVYGNSLGYIIGQYIYKQYITSISHCSIVHVEMVFDDLAEIFLNYFISTEYFRYGEQALDFLIISNKQDIFSKVITKYGELTKSCSYDKIYNFFYLAKEKQSDWKVQNDAFLLKNVGKFMDEERFTEIFNELVDTLNKELTKEKIIIFKVDAILAAINSNIGRISDGEEILKSFDYILKGKAPRFYGTVIEILNKMVRDNNKNINLEFLDIFLGKISILIEKKLIHLDEKTNSFLLDCSIQIEGSKEKIAEFLRVNSIHFYENKFQRTHDQLLKENIDTWITESVNKIEKSIDTNQKIPGVFSYGTSVFNDLIVTLNETKEVITEEEVDKILVCIEKILNSDFVQIGLKNEELDFLLCLLVIEKDNTKLNNLIERGKKILEIDNIEKVKDKSFESTPLEESYYSYLLNIEMMKNFLYEKDDYELLLNLNSRSSAEKIRSVRFIKHILRCYKDRKIITNQKLLLIFKLIVFNFIEEDSNELRMQSIEPLFLLSSFEDENDNLYFNKFLSLAEDSDIRVRTTIASILTHNEEYSEKFEGILNSLSQDNYYYIRELVSDKK
ncbi:MULTISPECIES: DUF4062 domain-containing protein [Enterococcus]|uniref:DUF4062 domain-containing protein n=1 Tax=Enterococcus TaxID=1350 RepID=UPI00124BCD2D|nr:MULTISPECIES: DUF4062 domain-containing protein [Enterococcus]GER77863.1 hypothetical protein EsFM111_26450 [Enterococcus sp. FM11-1]